MGRLALSLFLGVITLPILILVLSVETPNFETSAWAAGASLVLSGIAVGSVARTRHPAGRRGAMLITACACIGCWAVLYGLYAIAVLLQLDTMTWLFPLVLALLVAAFAAFSIGSIGIEWKGTWGLALGCGLAAEVGMYLAVWLSLVLLSTVVLAAGGAEAGGLVVIGGFFILIATVVGIFIALAAAVFFIGGGLLGGYLRIVLERHDVSSLLPPVPHATWLPPGTEDQHSPGV